jgi:UDP-N-acetylglucosamine 2-epimerase
MYDQFCYQKNRINGNKAINKYGLKPNKYIIATIHRAENTDNKNVLKLILKSLNNISKKTTIVFPLHPRTRNLIKDLDKSIVSNIVFVEPLPYKEMLELLLYSSMVITDSGGLQKEAYFAHVPCITVRDETEWVELVDSGWNKLCPPSTCSLAECTSQMLNIDRSLHPDFYGDGNTAHRILSIIEEIL